MVNFNEYMNVIDFSEFRNLFLNKGRTIEIKKSHYFVRQNESYEFIGFFESASLIKHSVSLTNIQAATDCTVYLLSIRELNDYWETNIDTQRFGRLVAEEMFVEMYGRLLAFYCDSVEQRYTALLQRCPNLPQYISLKEIASFIGVTPETISHIRKKLLQA